MDVSQEDGRPAAPLLRAALGSALRELREERGLSLRQAAARAGMSAAFLGEVERGLKEASSETLARLAAALGTSLPDVLYRAADELAAEEVSSAEAAGRLGGDETGALGAAAHRLARQLHPDDLHALVRFGEFLLARRQGQA